MYFDYKGKWMQAMGWLLTTRVSMDSHCRRLVSNTKTAIKEAKALCAAMIWNAEAKYVGTIGEVETAYVDHTHTLQ